MVRSVTEVRRVATVLAALIPLAVGCNSILGIKGHPLADGSGLGGTAGGGSAGGGTGTAGATGTGGFLTSCNADASVDGAHAIDAAAGPACGFTIPNPPGIGMPNAMAYMPRTDQTVYDKITGLTWEGSVDGRTVGQDEAARYCAAKPPSAAGPWRLPKLLELISLVDYTVPPPGPTIRPEFPDTPAAFFWTSQRTACDTAVKAWYVDFAKGDAHNTVVDSNLRIRCVSGTPANCSSIRYQAAGLGAVKDATTGLTWQQTVATEQIKTWSSAGAYCSTLGTGWRLPGPAELESIVDLTKAYPPIVPIDGDTFPGTPAEYFWTYAPEANNTSYAWYVAFVHGHIDSTPVGRMNTFVRCVRWDGP